MTEFKRRTLLLDSGKQIKLFGNSMAIGRSLEIGEGAAPNIFSCFEQQPEEKVMPDIEKVQQEIKLTEEGKPVKEKKTAKGKPSKEITASVLNPYKLTAAELLEIADYNIRLWMDLKDNIRRYGPNSTKVFNQDAVR